MSDPPKIRHTRWFLQLRLRTLLILMCVLGAALGLGGNFWRKLQQQRRAISQVQGAGGQVTFTHDVGRYQEDYDTIEFRRESFQKLATGGYERTQRSSAGTVIDYYIPPGPAFLRRFLGDDAFATVDSLFFSWKSNPSELDHEVLQAFPKLRILWLSNQQVSDDWLHEAAKLPQLRILNLSSDLTTDPPVNLTVLSQSRHLDHLGLSGKWLREETFADVAQLQQLKSLSVSYPPHVSSAILQHGKELKNLRSLSIVRAPGFADQDTTDLAELSQLRVLTLIDTSIGEPTLKAIGQIKNLESLELSFHKIGDREVKHLAGLHQLRHLNLRSTNVGDEGLQSLASLQELRILSLRHTNISPTSLAVISGLRELQCLDLYGLDATTVDEKFLNLRALPKLKFVEIGPTTPAALATLRNALPNCEIDGWDAKGGRIKP